MLADRMQTDIAVLALQAAAANQAGAATALSLGQALLGSCECAGGRPAGDRPAAPDAARRSGRPRRHPALRRHS